MATQDADQLADYFEGIADTYLFLSQMFFKELNDETIEVLEETEFPSDTGNEHLDAGYRLVRRYFNFAAHDKRTQLACEYARVFLASSIQTRERRTAVPYESAFTSEEHIVMQESRDDVVRVYKRDGFLVDPDLHEPEDHIAFEFEYLSCMSRAAAVLLRGHEDLSAFQENLEHQLDFIEKHLLNWIGGLLDAAKDYAKLAFYLGMLEVAIGTLEQSHEMLSALLEEIKQTSDWPRIQQDAEAASA
ncbi:MAG: molecular chaperone TorD family protein [Coriobacteriaceae bacterium]|nr:molecular chaperone TorD family protein [Coriobacteriaceae bacterium]